MGSVHVRGVNKIYKRYRTRWSRLAEWLTARDHHEAHWVLREVSFDIAPGESVGLVGHNGAGKSTLLKIITGTTRATSGEVATRGRIAALLELGMGFHPDFTGRQNAFMAGQLLGFTAEQIASRFEAIESFAEIGDYLDQPVRTYSSGMQMRLAFSVATCLRPDILIVDEALAVGDVYFQHKCIDRIRRFREEGTTLIFVSHSAGAVKSLCSRAILLDHGAVLRDGDPDDVLDYYNAVIAKQSAERAILESERTTGARSTRSGSGEATVTGIELIAAKGARSRAVRVGEPVSLVVSFEARTAIEELSVGVLIRDALGNDVFGTNTWHHGKALRGVREGQRGDAIFEFPALDLGRGTYSVSAALHSDQTHILNNYDWWDRALIFQVVPGPRPYTIGVCDLPVGVRLEHGEAA